MPTSPEKPAYPQSLVCLSDGLGFDQASWLMEHPRVLTTDAMRRVGQDLNPLFLATNHGLDYPVLLDIHGRLFTFSAHAVILPVTTGQAERNENARERVIAGRPLVDELAGFHFQIWAINPLLDQDGKRLGRNLEGNSILLRPEVEVDAMRCEILGVYWGFVTEVTALEYAKPGALAWYLGNDRYRVALRPYREENAINHPLVVATTLPKEQSLTPAV